MPDFSREESRIEDLRKTLAEYEEALDTFGEGEEWRNTRALLTQAITLKRLHIRKATEKLDKAKRRAGAPVPG